MKLIILSDRQCLGCGKYFGRRISKSGRLEGIEDFKVRIFCKRDCWEDNHFGEKNPQWSSKGRQRDDGYVRVSIKGKRVFFHRLLMEQKLGRKLATKEHVHHLDNNPSNNSIDNLALTTHHDHALFHSQLRTRTEIGRWL